MTIGHPPCVTGLDCISGVYSRLPQLIHGYVAVGDKGSELTISYPSRGKPNTESTCPRCIYYTTTFINVTKVAPNGRGKRETNCPLSNLSILVIFKRIEYKVII